MIAGIIDIIGNLLTVGKCKSITDSLCSKLLIWFLKYYNFPNLIFERLNALI